MERLHLARRQLEGDMECEGEEDQELWEAKVRRKELDRALTAGKEKYWAESDGEEGEGRGDDRERTGGRANQSYDDQEGRRYDEKRRKADEREKRHRRREREAQKDAELTKKWEAEELEAKLIAEWDQAYAAEEQDEAMLQLYYDDRQKWLQYNSVVPQHGNYIPQHALQATQPQQGYPMGQEDYLPPDVMNQQHQLDYEFQKLQQEAKELEI